MSSEVNPVFQKTNLFREDVKGLSKAFSTEAFKSIEEYGFESPFICLVQSIGRYLIIRVDYVYDGGFLSEGIYYPMSYPFCSLNDFTAKTLREQLEKNKEVGAVEINENMKRASGGN